jgi:hypothetical protein
MLVFRIVPVASEGGYVPDGYCILCNDCLAARRASLNFEHHLGPDAAVLFESECEISNDPLDICEDCNAGCEDPNEPASFFG